MMGNIPSLPLVLCIWHDANVGGDDAVTLENVAAYHKPTIVHTLGWLLKDDADGVTIVNEFYDNTYRGRTFVPRPMIVDVIYHKLSKFPKPRRPAAPPPPA